MHYMVTSGKKINNENDRHYHVCCHIRPPQISCKRKSLGDEKEGEEYLLRMGTDCLGVEKGSPDGGVEWQE
jgi:hypothetical protein